MARKFADQEPEAPAALPVDVPATEPAAELPISKLAEKHGQVRALKIARAGDPPFTPAHLFAAVINGWTSYELKMGAEATLTDAAYLAAIEAAKLGQAHDAAKKEGA